MSYRSTSLRVVLLLASIAGMVLHAQTPTGSIDGLVKDPSGALISNAQVTIRNLATGLKVERKTDSTGRYAAPLLLPGQYNVSATAPGFKTSNQTNVTLDVSQERAVDFTLSVGTTSEQVDVVEGSAATIDTLTSSTGQVITAKQIDNLPLNGRNPLDLALLAPGVQGTGDTAQTTPHISGSRNANAEQQIDGVSNIVGTNNIGLGYVAYQPIVDSVLEFSIQTSVPSAEYGRTSSGVINLVTKYGTNALHGSAFLFAHDATFDARPYFQSKNTPMIDRHRYQEGGTIGGPIYRNRAFFFLALERSSESSASQEIDSVPLDAWRTGDFSALSVPIYDPLTAVMQPNGKITRSIGDFVGNKIPASRQNAVALAAFKYYPSPNYGGANAFLNNYLAIGASKDTYYHGDARVDYQLTPNNRAFARFSKYVDDSVPFNGYGNAAAKTGSGPQYATATSVSLDDTWTIRPNLLAEFRYGLSRYTVDRTAFGQGFDISSLGLPGSFKAVAAREALLFPTFNQSDGYSALGMSGYVPYSSYNTAHDATASLILVKGRHNFKVGANFRKFFVNFYQYGQPSGEFQFNRSWTQYNPNDATDNGGGTAVAKAGHTFASMLLGLPSSGYMTHDVTALTASSYIAGYFQDDWSVTPKLTLNLGIRWEGEIPRTERHNQMTYWDPSLPSPLAGMIATTNCPACANLKGAMVFVGTPGAKYGRHQAPFQGKDFGPRIGFSYSPTAKWAIRGGYAILFGASALQAAGSTGGLGNDGFATTTGFQFSTDSQQTISTDLSDPAKSGFNLPTGAANGAGTQLGSGINYSFFDSVRNPYTEQANLNVQRQLPLQTVLEVGYVYSHGLFLVDGDPGQPYNQVNPSYLSLGNQLNSNVPNPFYGKITTPGATLSNKTVPLKYLLDAFPQYSSVNSQRKPRASSIYNSITVRLDKRVSQGLSLLVSYTGAKLMDNSSSAVTYLGPVSSTRADQFRPDKEWSLSAYDLASSLTIATTYELPFGRGHRFFSDAPRGVNLLINGWQANGIVSMNGGLPVVLSSVNNQTGLLSLGQRPNMAAGDPNLANRTHDKWFNTDIFSQPAAFTIGNAPRVLGNVRSPGNRNADLSAMKNNYFGHERRYNLQLRFEAFNALNHPIFGGPNANVNSANFGKITSIANGSRVIQFASKFIF
jgi:hypothetical protein